MTIFCCAVAGVANIPATTAATHNKARPFTPTLIIFSSCFFVWFDFLRERSSCPQAAFDMLCRTELRHTEHLPRLLGRGRFQAEIADHCYDSLDELCVGLRELATTIIDVVLKSDADATAQQERLDRRVVLRRSNSER